MYPANPSPSLAYLSALLLASLLALAFLFLPNVYPGVKPFGAYPCSLAPLLLILVDQLQWIMAGYLLFD